MEIQETKQSYATETSKKHHNITFQAILQGYYKQTATGTNVDTQMIGTEHKPQELAYKSTSD